jgi:N-acyl-D-aspartate/D-glutamate deacylase
MFDLVIRNAWLHDGSGAPAQRGALAVSGGRIAAIGPDLGPGRREIDAQGLALMPGIIDGHTHYDAQLTWDPFADPSPSLGVTTVVIGNCGFTIAPCRPADRDLTMRNLTQVEGMSLDALRAGSIDPYASLRSAYRQRRAAEIRNPAAAGDPAARGTGFGVGAGAQGPGR